jgi:transcriptional regulator with XRE-family HTH domain
MTVLTLEFGLHDYMRKSLEVAGLSVAEAAERLGVAPDTVSKWINGRSTPRSTALMAWSMVTGVDYAVFEKCARRDSNPQPSDPYPAAFIRPVLELWNTYKLVRSLVENASRRSLVALETRVAIAAAPAPAPGRDRDVVLWPSDNRGSIFDENVCRVCGCTDSDCSGCIERTGEPCHWLEETLCSACGWGAA